MPISRQNPISALKLRRSRTSSLCHYRSSEHYTLHFQSFSLIFSFPFLPSMFICTNENTRSTRRVLKSSRDFEKDVSHPSLFIPFCFIASRCMTEHFLGILQSECNKFSVVKNIGNFF